MSVESDEIAGLEVGKNKSMEWYLAHLLGYTQTEMLYSGNLMPQIIQNAKSISVDVDGFATITYVNPYGTASTIETKYLVAGAEYHIRKIVSWAAPGGGLTAAQVAMADGSLVNGIKLHR
ncbi:MAG: hypothetical protein PHE17_18095 [Thiothrix sp.]|uniref:hypothetical protein n=1 Tax=Thiothrix sp. TaxID=1032 RepID=UPI0026214BE3|nr:hypothetical protein [Thiothrix sp.]MDD5394933.1 hypothetical protein [Thiothrix sp.]